MSVYLIRHASAGVRGSYVDDDARPLDDVGVAQALAVAERLADAGIERIHSSAAVRCMQTVGPLAEALGLAVEPEACLLEGSDPLDVVELIERLGGQRISAALCSHGDMIPGTLQILADRGVPLDGSSCAKGSIWEVRFDGPSIVGASYHARAIS